MADEDVGRPPENFADHARKDTNEIDPQPCDFCGDDHCSICGGPMGMEEHEPALCIKRRNENYAHWVKNLIGWGYEKEAEELLEGLEKQGYIEQVVEAMERLGFLKPEEALVPKASEEG